MKMLGQEDNPARLREEIERAKQPAAGASAAGQAADGRRRVGGRPARRCSIPAATWRKSVPRRMAIISAGVIMNLIFAWIMAVVAIRCFSVREPAPGVGNILPGDGAWQADIRTGDTVLEVRGQPVKSYGDILEAVALGDAQHNIPMVISRPGRPEPLHVSVKVRQAGGKPRIGIGLPQTATLNKEDGVATFAATPAAEAQPPLAGGDKLVRLDEQPIHNFAELHAYLGEHADKPLRVTVQRALPAEKGAPPKDAKTQQVSVRVDSRPMRWLGVIMEMGPISAIQDGSPAAAAGIQPGDFLRTVDGAAVADPMTLPELFRGRAGQVVKLGIERPGEGVKEVSLTLRPGAGFDDPMGEDCPLAISSLGIAYHVLNNVHAVVPGTPAAAAGLQSGDVIAKATVLARQGDAGAAPQGIPPCSHRLGRGRVALRRDASGLAPLHVCPANAGPGGSEGRVAMDAGQGVHEEDARAGRGQGLVQPRSRLRLPRGHLPGVNRFLARGPPLGHGENTGLYLDGF